MKGFFYYILNLVIKPIRQHLLQSIWVFCLIWKMVCICVNLVKTKNNANLVPTPVVAKRYS